MAEQPLPRLDELKIEQGTWVVVRDPVSHPTATDGDWRTYPHMSSKENWKRLMGARAETFEKFLEDRRIHVNECPICSKCGHGMRTSFGGHVGAQFHFKDIAKIGVPDGVPVSRARTSLWQEFCVPGGGVRFNHADGAIEMMRGSLDGMERPATEGLGSSKSTEASLPSLEDVPEGEWRRVSGPVGMPTQRNGDYQTCSFFGSKACWKHVAQKPAALVLQFLDRYGIWPQCQLCAPQPCSFAEHIPAEKHFRSLESKLTQGVPVIPLAESFWQQWNVPGGALRFNHIHGAVDVWRGQPPSPDGQPPAAAAGPFVGPASGGGGAAPAAAPAHAGRPQPGALEKEGQWYILRPPASLAQVQAGDWRAYTHLQSRHTWKAALTGPADLICQVLEALPAPIYPECCFCGRSRGFQEHVPADKHFRMIYDKFLKDGVAVERVRHEAWQQWLIPGGAIRLNHLDGSVEMCKGDVPAADAPAVVPSTPGGLIDKRKFDGKDPRPPPYEPSEAPPRPPAGGPPTVREPDAEPQAASSQPSPAAAAGGGGAFHQRRPPVAAAAAAAAAAAPPARQEEGVMELCVWLWSAKVCRVADEVEARLRGGVAAEQLRCRVCEGVSMEEGVARHLVSDAHVKRVAAAIKAQGVTDLMLPGRGIVPSWSPSLVQCWDLPSGGRLRLCHFPLEVEAEQADEAVVPPPELQSQQPQPKWQGIGADQQPQSEWMDRQHQWRQWEESQAAEQAAPVAPPDINTPTAPPSGGQEWPEQQQEGQDQWRPWAGSQVAAQAAPVTPSEVNMPKVASWLERHQDRQEEQAPRDPWAACGQDPWAPRRPVPAPSELTRAAAQVEERPAQDPWAAPGQDPWAPRSPAPKPSEVTRAPPHPQNPWAPRSQAQAPSEVAKAPMESEGPWATRSQDPAPSEGTRAPSQSEASWAAATRSQSLAATEVAGAPAQSEDPWATRSQAPAPSEATRAPAQSEGVQLWWHRHGDSEGRAYWERNDEQVWFYEGDTEWKRYTDPSRGPYYYNSRNFLWFYESGEDMGVWRE